MKNWVFCGMFFVIFIVSLALSGCATTIYGTKQRIAVSSEPQGIDVRIGSQEGKTPCIITVSRKATKIILEKDGKIKEFELEKGFNGWATIGGNILWLFPGIVVDVITGGAFSIENAKLSMNGVAVTIEDKGSPSDEPATPNK